MIPFVCSDVASCLVFVSLTQRFDPHRYKIVPVCNGGKARKVKKKVKKADGKNGGVPAVLNCAY